LVILPFAFTACSGIPSAGMSRMKFDHIAIDVSQTPGPGWLPV
jgi:hypothetical protein